MGPNEDIHWLVASRGLSPVQSGWAQNAGATGPVVSAQGFAPSSSTAADAFAVRRLCPSDPYRSGPLRARDTFELQFRFRGASNTPSWAASSVHGVFIDDRTRAVMLSIGPQLQWATPAGVVLQEIQPTWIWQQDTTYLLVKVATERWQLWVEGELISELPYEAAEASASTAAIVNGSSLPWTSARVGWGRLDTAGSGQGYWDRIEAGLNIAIPREWRVRRFENAAPSPIRNRWNDRWEAVARASVGALQQAEGALERAYPDGASGRVTFERAAFGGTRLPWLEDAKWTIVGTAGNFVVVGDRIEIVESDQIDAVRFAVNTTRIGAEYRAAATFTLQSCSGRDTEGRAGPGLSIHNGHRRVTASLVWSEGAQSYGWVLHGGDLAASTLQNITGNVWWAVDAEQPHKVELRVIGHDRACLIIDDRLVDDVPYSRFTFGAAQRHITIGRGNDLAISSVVYIENGEAEVSFYDEATRPLFLQVLGEHLVFVGGREQNGRLATWGDRFLQVNSARGSLIGLRSEYRRIAGHDEIDPHPVTTPAGWFLNASYPGITPIYLNADGLLVDVWLEFYDDIPNYTPEEFCALIHRYLAPIDTLELQFHCGLITDLTSPTVTGSTTTFDVVSTRGFAVGDAVTLRETISDVVLTIDYTDRLLPTAVDALWVEVDPNGIAGGSYRVDGEGLGGQEYTGSFLRTGLDSDKDANLAANGTVTVVAASGFTNVRVRVFGVDASDVPQYEDFNVVGTAPVVGTKVFKASGVFGAIASAAAPGTITIQATTGAVQLYQLTGADRFTGGGCFLAAPALRGGPAPLAIFADAATTAPILVFGADNSDPPAHIGERIVLNGTTPVQSANTWLEVAVVALGYLPAARTIAITGQFNDRSAVVRVVSANAGDTGSGYIVGIDPYEQSQVELFALNGTTPVTLTKRWGRICAVWLLTSNAGAVTVSQVNGQVSGNGITLGQIFATKLSLGFEYRRLTAFGAIRARLNVDQVHARWIAVIGRRSDTGLLGVDVLRLTDAWVEGRVDFDLIYGFGLANVQEGTYAKIDGTAFVGSAKQVSDRLAEAPDYSAAGLPNYDAAFVFLRKDQGPEAGLRDQKPGRSTTIYTGWPLLYHATKGGSSPGVASVIAGDAGEPLLRVAATASDQVFYELAGADLTAFGIVWASGTFTVAFRMKQASGVGGIQHIVKANGGTSSTAEHVGIDGLDSIRIRYNGLTHTNSWGPGTPGTWYHVAIVVTANFSEIFLDGVSLGAALDHGGSGTSTIAQFFRNISSSDDFDFADLAIFARALSGAEVATLAADTDGDSALRYDIALWAHYLDPQRDWFTAPLGSELEVAGTYDVSENTVIVDISSVTLEVETTALTGSFGAGAVMRKEIG